MIIYKHEEEYNGSIKTTEHEADETAKTYSLKNKYGHSRVLKEDINKLQGRYVKFMYTLTPDNTPFIKALLDSAELSIKYQKESLQRLVERKAKLLKLLDEKGAAVHGDPIPAETSGEI